MTASDFTTEVRNSKLELQQALARFGAIHLYQPEVLPSEQLAEIGEVVREALIDGSPRIVTAVAPILLLRNDLLNLRKLHAEYERGTRDSDVLETESLTQPIKDALLAVSETEFDLSSLRY